MVLNITRDRAPVILLQKAGEEVLVRVIQQSKEEEKQYPPRIQKPAPKKEEEVKMPVLQQTIVTNPKPATSLLQSGIG